MVWSINSNSSRKKKKSRWNESSRDADDADSSFFFAENEADGAPTDTRSQRTRQDSLKLSLHSSQHLDFFVGGGTGDNPTASPKSVQRAAVATSTTTVDVPGTTAPTAEGSDVSSDTIDPPPTSTSSSVRTLNANQLEACEMARKLYEKCFVESESCLLDMMDNFPKFADSEFVLGDILGNGCFATVHEVRGFDLEIEMEQAKEHLATTDDPPTACLETAAVATQARVQRRHSFDVKREHVPDREVASGEMESRRFMAAHAFRKEGHARYAIKKLSPYIIDHDLSNEAGGGGDPRQQVSREARKLLVTGISDLVMEARILSAIEHPNIIKLRAIRRGDKFHPDFCLVLDRLYETLGARLDVWRHQRGGNVGNAILKSLGKRLYFRNARIIKASSYKDRLLSAYHLSSALQYLHQQRLIHRDLKPENIGFDCRGDIKIFDFGLAKEMPQPNQRRPSERQESAIDDSPDAGDEDMNVEAGTQEQDEDTERYKEETYKFTGLCGSPHYMAPEVAHKQPYNEKADVYSYTVLLYEMISLRSGFGTINDFATMFNKIWGPPYCRPNLEKCVPRPVDDLIASGWHYDLAKRPTMQELGNKLKEECLKFPDVDLKSLGHKRRKSKVIYDKEKCMFRINSMVFEDNYNGKYMEWKAGIE